MKIVIELKYPSDLWALMEYLRSFKDVTVTMPIETEKVILPDDKVRPRKTIGDFIGTIPTLDSDAFDQYLKETREEWERPIS